MKKRLIITLVKRFQFENYTLYLKMLNLIFFKDIIDQILKEDDFNRDGYLSYLEYVFARRRDELEEARDKSKKPKDKN